MSSESPPAPQLLPLYLNFEQTNALHGAVQEQISIDLKKIMGDPAAKALFTEATNEELDLTTVVGADPVVVFALQRVSVLLPLHSALIEHMETFEEQTEAYDEAAL
jgi:hypothetical protein